jgi:hypothetical protein
VNLREHLEGIYHQLGTLTPQNVVDTARDPSHPLHSRFEWDDSTAAEEYRKVQAAQLIRSVRVVRSEPSKDGDEETAVRVFHSVSRADGTTYMPLDEVVKDEFTREFVIRAAEREWKALYRRYKHLAEFLGMVRRDLEGAA